jgi:DNA-binding transcriptional MerR regulator
MPGPQRVWKVGELAGRTGLTVRTLHHYDRIGLLSPSGRTDSNHGAGHRLYTAADVARLQQILSLKMLGFSLERIREYLSGDDYDPRRVVRLHLERVRGQADELRRLAERLAALADALDKAEVVSADEFLATIEVMTMIEKYYTPEQLAQIEARKAVLGEERIKAANAEWPRLFAAVRAEMDSGTDPADPKVQALARKWYGLLDEFTGGDPGLFNSTRNMYANEDQIRGMDVKAMRPMFEYIRKAAAAAGIELPDA